MTQIYTVHIILGVGSSTEAWLTYQETHTPLKKMDNHSHRHHQLFIAPKLVVGPPGPPPSWMECWMTWFGTGLVNAGTASVSSWLQWLRHVQKTLFRRSSSWLLSLTIFPPTFSAMGPDSCRSSYNIDVPFMDEPSTVTYSPQWPVLSFCVN